MGSSCVVNRSGIYSTNMMNYLSTELSSISTALNRFLVSGIELGIFTVVHHIGLFRKSPTKRRRDVMFPRHTTRCSSAFCSPKIRRNNEGRRRTFQFWEISDFFVVRAMNTTPPAALAVDIQSHFIDEMMYHLGYTDIEGNVPDTRSTCKQDIFELRTSCSSGGSAIQGPSKLAR